MELVVCWFLLVEHVAWWFLVVKLVACLFFSSWNLYIVFSSLNWSCSMNLLPANFCTWNLSCGDFFSWKMLHFYFFFFLNCTLIFLLMKLIFFHRTRWVLIFWFLFVNLVSCSCSLNLLRADFFVKLIACWFFSSWNFVHLTLLFADFCSWNMLRAEFCSWN